MRSGDKKIENQYNPVIDGLRALAVFAVIFYHAKLNFLGLDILKGGFLGVDIFFLISGYLISKIIFLQINNSNNFSFREFYIKRFKRIYPALLLTIFLSSMISLWIFSPRSLLDYAYQSISSILAISNIYFWITNNAYGAELSLFKPLMHTWSLSIEIQYYIFFPIFFIFICNFFKKNILKIVIFSTLISIFICEFLVYEMRSSFNFYIIFSRIFEFLCGTILFLISIRRKNTSDITKKGMNYLPFFGLIVVIASFFFFNDKDNLPSILSLIILIGVSIIILNSKKFILVNVFLSNKIIVYFGKISYSLYLFHFPLFAFARYIEFINNDTNIKKIFLIILTILLASFSYFFIEKPFRTKNKYERKHIIFLFILVISTVVINLYTIKSKGWPDRYYIENIVDIKNTKKIIYNDKGTKGDVVLIGDSHSMALEYDLNERLKNEGYNFKFLFTHLFVENLNLYNNRNQLISLFNNNNNKIENFINEHKNITIILHSRWSQRLLGIEFDDDEVIGNNSKDNFIKIKPDKNDIEEVKRIEIVGIEITKSIKKILDSGNKIILVYPVPEHEFDPYKKLFVNNIYSKNNEKEILSTSYHNFKKRNQMIYKIFDNIVNENLYRVYPEKFFCNNYINNRCATNDAKNLFYYDGDHLSIYGSSFVNKDIIQIIKNTN
jgi:peptidoglycan/LPS O-acetylase OafA/YrhL